MRDVRSFNDLLGDALTHAASDGKYSSSAFFTRWFRNSGRSYFFLFKKNLRVTNIQYGELIALLKTCIATPSGIDPHQLQFISTSRFTASLQELVHSFPDDVKDGQSRSQLLVELYGQSLRSTIAIDTFFGSCAVYIPPELTLDLAAVCAYAGYIHSCGELVLARKVDKAVSGELFDAVATHLASTRGTEPKRVFFAVYAHEDFTEYDRALSSDLRDGLDDVKIFAEKFYMGSERIVSVLNSMRERFARELEIPDPGNYRQKHRQFRTRDDVDKTQTLWLIIDQSVTDSDPRRPGTERYFVCYAQRYVNENPFHIFDENKPGWRAHTTIPHTLAGAMLNVTRPWWPNDGSKVVVGDPFAGTGTIALECLKFPRLIASCGDFDSLACLAASDNAEFFAAAIETLKEYETALLALHVGQLSDVFVDVVGVSVDNINIQAAYQWSTALLDLMQQTSRGGEITASEELIVILRSKSLFERILFYIALRTAIRHFAAFDRGSEDWATAYKKEVAVLLRQVNDLVKLREREQARRIERRDAISISQGSYTPACSIGRERIDEWYAAYNGSVVELRDAREMPIHSCDIVISDPPYGFNTDENPNDLARLYSSALDAMIGAIKGDGQIVLCLLDRSHIGRQSLFFTTKDVVIQQILIKAENAGFEVISATGRTPNPYQIFRLPYYWEAERALRRAIVHFILRRRGPKEELCKS